MFYVEKQCMLDDSFWIETVKDNYINNVLHAEHADDDFKNFVKNKTNLKIKKKLNFIYSANWDIELTYKVTVSKSYEVFDGYDVKTEGTLTPRYNATGPNNLHLEEKTTYNPQSHRETQTLTDNVKSNITKFIVSRNGYYSSTNSNIDKSSFKNIQENDMIKLLGTNYKHEIDSDLNNLKEELKNKDVYKEDKKAYRKMSSNLVGKDGCTLSNLEIVNVEVTKPNLSNVDVYVCYEYELEVEYENKKYISSISGNDFYMPELKISKEAQKKLDKTALFVNLYNKIGKVFTYVISAILSLFVIFGIFVKLYLYNPDWSQTFLKFPFLLVNIVLIVLLILFSIRLSDISNFLISQNKEGSNYAIKNQKHWKKTIKIRTLLFYLVAILCVALFIFEIFCLIRIIPLISGVKISFL